MPGLGLNVVPPGVGAPALRVDPAAAPALTGTCQEIRPVRHRSASRCGAKKSRACQGSTEAPVKDQVKPSTSG
jgi:hypothetical protein